MGAPVRPRFVLTLLGWAGGLSGGDRHLLEVAARWRNHVDVKVVAPTAAASTIERIAGKLDLEPLGTVTPLFKRLPPMLAVEHVRRALLALQRKRLRPDVVVAGSHFLPDAAALTGFARRGAFGVAYIYHLVAQRRSLDARALWSKADERLSLALLRRYADLVFTSNAETGDSLTARGFGPVRTAVGIDLSQFRRAGGERQARQAIFIARMTQPKGALDAVSAWALIVERVPDARLVMVGDGPQRERGIALATRLGIGASIDWPGVVTEEKKRTLLSESRVLVAPSYEEGWGIAVCEGLASGVPVVAYRLPVLDELFPNAYRPVAPGDVATLAAEVVLVLEDDEVFAQLARIGRTTAGRYDVDRVAEVELEEILRRLAERPG